MKHWLFFALLSLSISCRAQLLRSAGVMINATDLDQALGFYCDKLGFEVRSRQGDYVFLKTGDDNMVVLHKVTNLVPELNEARAGLSLQVNDLDKTIAALKGKGIDFSDEQKRKEGVGYAIYVKDPFGKKVSLIQQTVGKTEFFKEPRIYNYGFMIPDMTRAVDFYASVLGFVERSQKYLPSDMPLGHGDGTFAFMLHFREGVEAVRHNSIESEHVVVLFSTSNIDSTMSAFRKRGVQVLQKKLKSSELGKSFSFFDPFGYLSEVIQTEK